jgi:hypothetical protein
MPDEFNNPCPNASSCLLKQLFPVREGWELKKLDVVSDEKRVELSLEKQNVPTASDPTHKMELESKSFVSHILGHILEVKYHLHHKVESRSRKKLVTDKSPVYSEHLQSLDDCRRAAYNIIAAIISLSVLAWSSLQLQSNEILGTLLVTQPPQVLNPAEMQFGWAFLISVIFQYIRMFLGMNFLDFDKTFLVTLSISKDSKKIIFERIARIMLLIFVLLLPFALKSKYEKLCLISVWVLAVFPIMYSICFWHQLFVADVERKSNIFILVGDGVFCLSAVLYTIYIVFRFDVSSAPVGLFYLLPGGIGFIVVCELIVTYAQSFRDSLAMTSKYFRDATLR